MLFRGRTNHVAAFVDDQRARTTGADIDAEKMNRSLRSFCFEVFVLRRAPYIGLSLR